MLKFSKRSCHWNWLDKGFYEIFWIRGEFNVIIQVGIQIEVLHVVKTATSDPILILNKLHTLQCEKSQMKILVECHYIQTEPAQRDVVTPSRIEKHWNSKRNRITDRLEKEHVFIGVKLPRKKIILSVVYIPGQSQL